MEQILLGDKKSPKSKTLTGGKMLNAVVIYRSKYGSTKRYAEWIAEELNADIFAVSEFDVSKLENYSIVLFGSSVHIGKVKGITFIKNNWPILSKKKVVVFASTGSPKIEPKQQQVVVASLPPELCQLVKYFPLPAPTTTRSWTLATNSS